MSFYYFSCILADFFKKPLTLQLILPVQLYINESENITKAYKGWTANQFQGQGYLKIIIFLHQITEYP